MELKPSELDLNLLERNLTLSPEQRIIEHQKALDLVLELKIFENGRKNAA